MKIDIDWDWLKKQKLFVATPCYGGMCTGTYARSVTDLIATFQRHGINVQLYSLFNESLITRARAYACDEFLRSDSTHLLFIDSDIGFKADDVLVTMALMKDEQYDVVGAPYPKKCIAWEKIKIAVDKGYAEKNPNDLENFTGDFVFNPVPGTTQFRIDEPAEMLEIGTGFMMIRRSVLDDFRKAYPRYEYRPDHIRTELFDGSRMISMFFQAEVDRPFLELPYRKALEEIAAGGPGAAVIAQNVLDQADKELSTASLRYLSEDYNFCQLCRKMGKRVWLLPWIQLTHTGSYVWGGSVAAMAAIGASPTADAGLLKNK